MPTLAEIKALRGVISTKKVVKGNISPVGAMSAELNKNGRYREYNGPYEIEPDDVEQIMNTKDKLMNDNVTIHEVPLALATREQIDELFGRV